MQPNSFLRSKLKAKALEMRSNQTSAEALLWERLRNRKCGGFKFRRQHVIGRFVVDFYCAAAKLVVEVDGPIHRSKKDEDTARETELTRMGLRVIRFDNDQVVNQTENAVARIGMELEMTAED